MLSFVLEDVFSLLLSEPATRSRPIPLNTLTFTSILGLAQSGAAATSMKSKQARNFIGRLPSSGEFIRNLQFWPVTRAWFAGVVVGLPLILADTIRSSSTCERFCRTTGTETAPPDYRQQRNECG